MRDTAHPKIKQYTDKRTGRPRYLVRYRKPDGTQTKKRGFTRKKDAEDWLHEIESAKLRGEFIPVSAGRTRLTELYPGWLAAKRVHCTPGWVVDLDASWRTHVEPRWAQTPVRQVRAGDIQEWIAELSGQRSPTIVIRAHGVLAGILDDAVRDGKIRTNPARGVKLPRKSAARSRYLTHAEVQTVAEASGHELLVYVLAYCGLRWGEATALRVRDVNLLRRRISVTRAVRYIRGTGFKVGDTKGKEDRTVPVPGFLAAMLEAAVTGAAGPDALIFPAPRAEYLRQPGKSRVVDGKRAGVKWWERALDDGGVEWMTPHDLRHTAASLAVSAGANVKAVQQMLGRKSASLTLDTYADLFDSDLDDVAVRMDAQRGHALGTIRGEQWGTDPNSQGTLGIVRDVDPGHG